MRLILVLLCAFTLFLTGYNFQQTLSASLWWQAIVAPQVTDVSQMLFHYSMLPRTTLALLTGAGLALAGCLFQHILRNPLAEPATLGVAAGAQLGLTLATLFLAGAGETGKQLAALAGAMAVGSIVLGAAWGKRMSPVTLILAGLVLGLYCGAVKSFLVLFNHERLQNLFIWSSGMLNQYDWAGVYFLWPRLLAVLVLIVLMIRPLGMLALDDTVLRGLGMKLALVRVAGLFLALLLSSMLVSIVGVIGFIGLFAPILAGMFGVRRLLPKLLASMVMGALLLVRRWLVILPLGGEAAQALGVTLSRSRITILMLAAGLVAAATLCVGPLSFIGLMAPHMARMLGFRRAMPQLVMAIAIGSGLMLVADWLGRSLIFPFQIPAGLLATLCGAPYFIWLLRKA